MELSQLGMANHETHMISQDIGLHCHSPKWYFSRGQIDDHSPSRKDGIDLKTETQLRASYCSFLQELGIKLKVPQVTIATAMMLCHRFYMRQSHAKNECKTLATVSMFLACKVEETPRLLKDVAVKAYEIMYRGDLAAAQRINHKDVYQKQKELITNGERLLLVTMAFDLNIQQPYKPLVSALKKLKIPHNDLAKVAWNFVNDWLQTTLCLQYKPHYIAAGSLYLAAKFLNVKLPSDKGKAWWLEFDVSPHQLEEVIRRMIGSLEHNRRLAMPLSHAKPGQDIGMVKKVSSDDQASTVTSTESTSVSTPGTEEKSTEGRQSNKRNNAYVSGTQILPSEDTWDCAARSETPQFPTSNSGSPHSIVEDGDRSDEGEVQVTKTVAPNGVTGCKIVSDYCTWLDKIDKDRIREAFKRRRYDRLPIKQAAVAPVDCRDDDDSWIVRELECGVEMAYAYEEKRQRIN